MRPVIVVGAGWSGAVVAHRLAEAGVKVEVFERDNVVGGHARVETLNGVVYEPNGPHLLHTNNARVSEFWQHLGLARQPYRFQPKAEIELPDGELRLMSWPIQVDELETLPDWSRVKSELADVDQPVGADFETYATSLMGRRLYELFIEAYTRKQWGCEPSELSSSFAPKRIDVRYDGNRDLFRDRWQWFPTAGPNAAIESLLSTGAGVTVGVDARCRDLESVNASAFVITAACDAFLREDGWPGLPWRGIRQRSRYIPTYCEKTVQAAYVINRNHMRVPYTRTIETKHATGQWVEGTVVSEELPGAALRHYPVHDVNGTNDQLNRDMQDRIRERLAPTPTFFTGRLATYRYINQDEAILSAWECADTVLRTLAG